MASDDGPRHGSRGSTRPEVACIVQQRHTIPEAVETPASPLLSLQADPPSFFGLVQAPTLAAP